MTEFQNEEDDKVGTTDSNKSESDATGPVERAWKRVQEFMGTSDDNTDTKSSTKGKKKANDI
jgi:hypothetical protein